MIESDRIIYSDEIIKHIIDLIHKELNIFTVNITLARELDKELMQIIENVIMKQPQFMGGEIIVKKRVNPEIIGGFIAETENISIDGSLKNSLKKITEL